MDKGISPSTIISTTIMLSKAYAKVCKQIHSYKGENQEQRREPRKGPLVLHTLLDTRLLLFIGNKLLELSFILVAKLSQVLSLLGIHSAFAVYVYLLGCC